MQPLDFTQLKYFQVVAEKENITRAAEELHISQPSLSISISNLEKTLGLPLFERRGRRIILNKSGQVFLKRVERCFTELEEGRREINDINENAGRNVTLGIDVINIFPAVLQNFFIKYPDTKLHVTRITSREQLVAVLLKGEIDIAITNSPIEGNDIVSCPFFTEELILMVSTSHPLAAKEKILLSEAAAYPFIMRITETGEESGMVKLTNELCGKAGFYPRYDKVVMENGSIILLLQLVAANLGVALVPEHVCLESSVKSVKGLHIEEPYYEHHYYISFSKSHYLSDRANLLYETLKGGQNSDILTL